ncbi:MAG: hypothetical protein WCQ32_03080 [bacterium]
MKNKYLLLLIGGFFLGFFISLLINTYIEIPHRYIPIGIISSVLVLGIPFTKIKKGFDDIKIVNPLKKKSRTIG